MEKFSLPAATGVAAIGLKTGLIIPNDDIAAITAEAAKPFVEDKDIICVTEAVVARSQNRYLSCSDLAEDVQKVKSQARKCSGGYQPHCQQESFCFGIKSLSHGYSGGKIILQFRFPLMR